MYSGEYLPHFESDEQERIQTIKDHLANKDLDYLYKEFDFEENEDIIDAYFDNYDQLHIIYNTTEPEDLVDEDDEDLIECTDGVKRTQYEYDMWISNLLSLYEMEPGDLNEDELQALSEAGYIESDSLEEDDIDNDEVPDDEVPEKPWDYGKHFE